MARWRSKNTAAFGSEAWTLAEDVRLCVWPLAERAAGGLGLCVYRCDPHILPVPPEVPEVGGLVGPGAEGAGIGGPRVPPWK